MLAVYRCDLLITDVARSVICVIVCVDLSVGHMGEPCKNG